MNRKINIIKNGQNHEVEYIQSIVFLGANGSGKSRLGAWIEQQNPKKVHRISAQRNLSFNEETPLRSMEASKLFFHYGSDFKAYGTNKYWETNTNQAKSSQRWSQGKYTTGLLNDYDHLLSLLFSQQNLRNEELVKKIDSNIGFEIDLSFKPLSNIEKLIDTWNRLLPHRKIKFSDQKILVSKDSLNYKGTELSDGERVIIYLIGQILSVEENNTIIVDEPEIHIHKSIINILWDELEKLRDDISIFYITHDLEFAKERLSSKKIWIKEYGGDLNWNWEEINFDDEDKFNEIHFEIMGSRKPILFVEGTKGSLDYKIYSKLYATHTVIPVESCETVIDMVGTYQKEWTLHNLKPYGIVDKDFREESDINALREKNVEVLNVLEIENLLCLPSVVEKLYEILEKSLTFQKTKKEVIFELKSSIEQLFNNELEKTIINATHKRISNKLSKFPKPNQSDEFKDKFDSFISSINIDDEILKISDRLNHIKEEANHSEMLKYLDNKYGLIVKTAQLFEMHKNRYIDTIIKNIDREEIIEEIKQYIPTI